MAVKVRRVESCLGEVRRVMAVKARYVSVSYVVLRRGKLGFGSSGTVRFGELRSVMAG